MTMRKHVGLLIFGICVSHLVAPAALSAAEAYTLEDQGVADAIRAAGPNRSGQTAVRSGFVSATSHRITPG